MLSKDGKGSLPAAKKGRILSPSLSCAANWEKQREEEEEEESSAGRKKRKGRRRRIEMKIVFRPFSSLSTSNNAKAVVYSHLTPYSQPKNRDKA